MNDLEKQIQELRAEIAKLREQLYSLQRSVCGANNWTAPMPREFRK